jgi:uncharacterized protein YoxC
MEPQILTSLVNLGAAGAVIVVVIYLLKYKAESDKTFLDRLDKIENRHLDEERADRDQTRALFDQTRALFDQTRVLFDRVIGICNDLSAAVRDLSNNTKANEKAIHELREEFRMISAPRSHRPLPHEEPPPRPLS